MLIKEAKELLKGRLDMAKVETSGEGLDVNLHEHEETANVAAARGGVSGVALKGHPSNIMYRVLVASGRPGDFRVRGCLNASHRHLAPRRPD